MPSLRDALSDNFEGSSFVWKRFKDHPALSIFGLPLVLLEAALLPIRMITNRKDWLSNDDRDRERLTLEPGMPGFDGYAAYNSRDLWKHVHDQQRELFHSSAVPTSERDYSHERNGKRKHKDKRSSAKIGHESVLYPGWALPHGGLVARLKHKSESELGRTASLGRDMFCDRHGRDYLHGRPESILDRAGGNRSAASSLRDQYRNPPPDLHGHAMPPQAFPERLSRQGSHAQAPPARAPLNQLPQMQGDFAQAGDQQPYRPPGFENVAPAPGNYAHPTASTVHSGSHSSHPASKEPSHVISSRPSSRRSKTATARSGITNNEDGDESESYISQSVRSLGTHKSARDRQPWPKPPSIIRTHPQFKPTHRVDSVAPWESASQRGTSEASYHPAESLHSARVPSRSSKARSGNSGQRGSPKSSQPLPENLHSAQVPSRNSKARSCTSGRPVTIDEVSERGSSSARASRSGMFKQPISAGPPPRSPSIITINTADLPDAIPGSSRSRSTASHARSYRTAVHQPQVTEPVNEEEEDPEELSSSYDSTYYSSGDESEAEAPEMPGSFPQAGVQPDNGYWHPPPVQQQQAPYAQPMQVFPPGMQQSFQQPGYEQPIPPTEPQPGFEHPQQPDQYGRRSRRPPSQGYTQQG